MSSLPNVMLGSIWEVAAAFSLQLVWGRPSMLRPAGVS